MKRILTLAVVIFMTIASTRVSAQEKPYKRVRLGIGLETGLPVGNLGNAYTFGAGGSFRLAVALNEKFAATATAGAMAFIPKSISGVDLKAQLNVPIKGGLKYMLSKKIYTLGEAGATIARIYYPTPSGQLQSVSSTGFTYAANIGTQLGKFDASLRYEGYTGAGFIGLRLGLNF